MLRWFENNVHYEVGINPKESPLKVKLLLHQYTVLTQVMKTNQSRCTF